jgi:predicted nucleic acid-binding Zn ribbon protein
MPTYTFRCAKCGNTLSTVMGMREYCAAPPAFVHCSEVMDRFFETVPGLAIHNPGAGDRHYDGLRATDGTDISSRSKHREYMRANNLTTADDFTQTWAKAEQQRREVFSGNDTSRAGDIARAIDKLSST